MPFEVPFILFKSQSFDKLGLFGEGTKDDEDQILHGK